MSDDTVLNTQLARSIETVYPRLFRSPSIPPRKALILHRIGNNTTGPDQCTPSRRDNRVHTLSKPSALLRTQLIRAPASQQHSHKTSPPRHRQATPHKQPHAPDTTRSPVAARRSSHRRHAHCAWRRRQLVVLVGWRGQEPWRCSSPPQGHSPSRVVAGVTRHHSSVTAHLMSRLAPLPRFPPESPCTQIEVVKWPCSVFSVSK